MNEKLVCNSDYTVEYSNNVSVGVGRITIKGKGLYTGTITRDFQINKLKNTLSVSGKKVVIKYKKLKKKKQTIKIARAAKITNPKGKVTYKKVKLNKKKYAKKFIINKKTGKITVKRGVKKGTYKMTIKVHAAGDKIYKSKTKKVVVTIKVK